MMRRFSSCVVLITSVTCNVHDFPTSVHVGVFASINACRLPSSSGLESARHVDPNALIRAVLRSNSVIRSKNSTSFGLDPGQPPSI